MNKNILIKFSNIAAKRNHLIKIFQQQQTEYRDGINVINHKPYTKWSYVWRFLFFGISFILFILSCNYLLPKAQYINEAEKFIIEWFGPVFVMGAFITVSTFLVFIIILICRRISYCRKRNRAYKKINMLTDSLPKLEKEINQLSSALAEMNLLSPYYWCYADVIMNYIILGRADTIKEAINLFEFEKRQNMQFKAQMDYLQNINNTLKRNGTINAAGFVTNGIINAIGFSSIHSRL